MASTTQTKTLCSNCAKATGILRCCGCKKDFCYRHVSDHREELNKQMIELTTKHDQLKKTISEQQTQPNCHPLMKQIDSWEQTSIEKIHQAANEAREELLPIMDKYRTKVSDTLAILTQELTEARNEDDYVETDLKEWTEKLNELNIELAAAQLIRFDENNDNTTFLISKIFINDISNNRFETWFGDIQMTEHDNLILHGRTHKIAAVYSKNAYSSGQHRFRFQIVQLNTDQSFTFGIVSSDMCVNLSLSISRLIMKCRNLYSNSGGCFYQNGICLFSLNLTTHAIQINDIIQLQIDCDRQTILFINERKNQQQVFNTNLNTCKLPWRMVISFVYANDCVRLR